jgi:hypothetical protein
LYFSTLRFDFALLAALKQDRSDAVTPLSKTLTVKASSAERDRNARRLGMLRTIAQP